MRTQRGGRILITVIDGFIGRQSHEKLYVVYKEESHLRGGGGGGGGWFFLTFFLFLFFFFFYAN